VHDASWAAVANAGVYLRGRDAFALSGIDGFELTCTAPGDVTLVGSCRLPRFRAANILALISHRDSEVAN
jgi:hypothetical protein